MDNYKEDPFLRQYLEAEYAGIFDAVSIETHIRDYVGFVFSDSMAPLVAQRVKVGDRVLDVGCGFGAFVISARRLGLDVMGIEIAPFEIEYARRRLQKEMPELTPESVYYLGDGNSVPFDNCSFDAVTLWNVLEHVPDTRRLLREVRRVLKPGGWVFIICPNYAAFRNEAHYQLPWFPLLPRRVASLYLRLCGRDPRFFETSIFYRTNWEVQRELKRLNMQIFRIEGPAPLNSFDVETALNEANEKILNPGKITNTLIRLFVKALQRIHLNHILLPLTIFAIPLIYVSLWWKRILYNIDFYNPMVDSVILSARRVSKHA